MTTKVANVDLDAWFSIDGPAGASSNGKGIRMSVGHGIVGSQFDQRNRCAIRIPRGTLFSTISDPLQISAFNIRLKVSNDAIGYAPTPRFWLERATAPFTENAAVGTNMLSGSGTPWPGPVTETTDRVKFNSPVTDYLWITIPMLALGRRWFSTGWTNLYIRLTAADAASGYDEANQTVRCSFYTHNDTTTGNRPYAELVYSANLPPNAPTDLTPTGGALASSTPGTSLAMTARHSDPNGDAATEDQFEVYPDSSTDASLGTVTRQVYTVAATAQLALRTRTATGLTARTFYKWRARFKDASAYGPWSALQRALLAYQPATPTNPAVTPGTVDPDFFASLVSQDPADFVTAAEINVYQDPATGSTITKWASGKQAIGGSSNRAQVSYSGSPLSFGIQYRWQIRLWNRDDVASPFTANLFFTPRETTGPVITPSGTSVKLNTRTPTFVLTDQGGQSIDQHRMRFYSPTGALLRDTGIVTDAAATSISVPTPSGIWDWGQNPSVDAAIRVAGNADMGPFSEAVTVHLNAAPGAPYPLSVETAGAIQKLDGSWVVDAATPQLRIPFRDADVDLGYSDQATRREVEISTLAGTPLSGSPFIATSSITDLYTTPTLTNETTYRIRARYDDNAGVRSEWSDYLIVKRSSVPTLTSVTPANAATITDPTTLIDWTFNSTGGKLQAQYRVVLSAAGAPFYDSGIVASAATEFAIPAGALPNATTVSWSLQVWDTDGLPATLTRTFTTNFTVPPAPTGLVVTPDTDALGLQLTWDATTLTAGEFDAWLVYAKSPDGPFELVATITDPTVTSYLYLGAEHNADVEVRVTQTNGFGESDPVEGFGTLAVDGYWWLAPEPIELRWVTPGSFDDDPIVTTEELEPLAGGRVILTWGDHGTRWTLRMRLPADAGDTLRALRADMIAGTVGILKTPRSQAFYSVLTKVPASHQIVGQTDVTISGSEVARDTLVG